MPVMCSSAKYSDDTFMTYIVYDFIVFPSHFKYKHSIIINSIASFIGVFHVYKIQPLSYKICTAAQIHLHFAELLINKEMT